jgi:hydroxymethylpyrimidine kinase/phosphomethylpyrimidine kinase
MVSTSGSQLLAQESVRELRESLLPITTILTPNVPEAQLILKDAGVDAVDPQDVDGLIALAKSLQSLGPQYVLVKGGHLPLKSDRTVAKTEEEKAIVIDILYGEGIVTEIQTVYQDSKNTHGTGCSLACK